MHYTLIHYDIPSVDLSAWTLEVVGQVRRPLALTLDHLRARPHRSFVVTLECAGDGRALLHPRPISQPWLYGAVGTAEWTGTPLSSLLEDASLKPGVQEIVFTGVDQGVEGDIIQPYQRSLPLQVALNDDVLLAWEMNGAALEPQHGFPLRLVAPGWYGMASVKWLSRIEALAQPFEGYQQTTAYRFSQSREEPGDPVNVMRVRSLMIPPGIPDFLTRVRLVLPGPVELMGRAWVGQGTVVKVEVSIDDGASWESAELGAPVSERAWYPWLYVWDAKPGTYRLCCRATDSGGSEQPLHPYNKNGPPEAWAITWCTGLT